MGLLTAHLYIDIHFVFLNGICLMIIQGIFKLKSIHVYKYARENVKKISNKYIFDRNCAKSWKQAGLCFSGGLVYFSGTECRPDVARKRLGQLEMIDRNLSLKMNANYAELCRQPTWRQIFYKFRLINSSEIFTILLWNINNSNSARKVKKKNIFL